MFSEEIRALLLQVITSWQVLAVTVFLLIYISIVNYVARIYYRRSRKPPKPKKVKQEAPEMMAPSDDDELGLEEKTD